MAELIDDIRLLLVRELRSFGREIELFPDDELVWHTAAGVTNSAGNLALHVSGNLRHFVGAVLGGTGYVRDRELEFSRRSGTRDEVVREIEATIQAISESLPRISSETLAGTYPEAVGGFTVPTQLFLLHLAAHLAHHLGQAGYLRRILTGQNQSSGAIAVKALA